MALSHIPRGLGLGLALAAALVLSPRPSTAARHTRNKRSAAVDVAALRAQLGSADDAQFAAGLEAVARVPRESRAAAAQVVLDVLALGTTSRRATGLLGALAALGPLSGPKAEGASGQPATPAAGLSLVRGYRHHRDPRVRAQAVTTLSLAYAGVVEPDLVAALGDGDALVRRAAVDAVAKHRIAAAVPRLLALLAKGEDSVPSALGVFASADLAHQVQELIGHAPDALVSRALGAMLSNPTFGPEDARVEVVHTLAGLPGSEALEVLTSYVSSMPDNVNSESRSAAESAVEARLGGE